MDQMMGNLFYRGVPPSEIKAMQFWEMKYWNKWHEIMAKKEEQTAESWRKKYGGR